MVPRDLKDVTRDTARDLSGLAGELAALKADAHHWLTDQEYAALRYRLETGHAAGDAALVISGINETFSGALEPLEEIRRGDLQHDG